MRQVLFAETPFNPIRLFRAGEQGAWYDPSDLSTLFKLSTDTEANVAAGDPVGKILDKSGRGNHATQTTLTSRPILRQDEFGRYYLEFDGTDDCLFTGNINFTATDKVTTWAGVRKLNDTAYQVIAEFSASPSLNDGTFALAAAGSNVTRDTYVATSRGTNAAAAVRNGYAAPSTNIITGIGDISGDICSLRVNGSTVASPTTDQGAGNYGTYPLYIGRRNNEISTLAGRIYSLIIRGAQSTDAQITQTEAWVNRKTGAY